MSPRRPAPFRLTAWLALLAFALLPQAAFAQSILRDAETEALLRDMSDPLVSAAGLQPGQTEFLIVNDSSINAFVAGGQRIYIHSGLFEAADDAGQVQGVIAHELGHIAGGHVIRFDEATRPATGITIASLLLGALAVAAGGGEAGMGIIAAGQQAAMSNFLSYTRAQESVADASGARYLSAAGISGKGSIDFFKKLQNFEYRLGIPQDNSFGRTHPLTGERIATLEDSYRVDPAWDRPTPAPLQARFARVRAKLVGYIAKPEATLRDYPPGDTSVPARYARAYAYHKQAHVDQALGEVRALLAESPNDPYYLELYGQILLESGRPNEAIEPLRTATRLTGNQPLIAGLFGHALIESGRPELFDEAERVLRAAVARDNQNPFAWYQLGVIYDRKGDGARASLANAERQLMTGEPRLALIGAQRAMAGLPQDSPDWIRAQDIKLVAERRAADERRGRRGS